ncbi:MAG: 3-deoxy-8-phosphooctulonate synthase [Deltaproteobacteria bacterium]|nr:3-deoxy-8-phosphooctulonate synthase [Deltaproteobacteria bacterium]
MGPVPVGGNHPPVFIAGPCVAEDAAMAFGYARRLKDITARHGVPFVFKASYDKANRTSGQSFRGPGLKEGLAFLGAAAREVGVPLLVDVHETAQVGPAAAVADVLQVPAFLSRQTDLVEECARSGRALNVKKGQFLAPDDVTHILSKAREAGGKNLTITERGTTFGYHNLVVDMRGLWLMRQYGAPVIFDATHSVQLPGGAGGKSGGQREMVAPLARAAAAVGVDGYYMEVHEKPELAKSDGPNALTFEMLDELVGDLVRIHRAVGRVTA